MAGVTLAGGLKVVLSGNGQGAIASALRTVYALAGASFVDDAADATSLVAAFTSDVALCTTGRLRLKDIRHVYPLEIDDTYRSNYLHPRCFCERHLRTMEIAGTGTVVVLGSNAALGGQADAEDYAAMKAALRLYCHLRGRTSRARGVRLIHVTLGAVASPFWEKATHGRPANWPDLAPDPRKALTPREVAEAIAAVVALPAHVTVKDLHLVSTDYQ